MSYSPDSEEPKSYVGSWIVTLLLLVGFVLGLLLFPPLYDAPKGEQASLVLFIGRFHPIFLHLPVGALSFLMILEVCCMTRRGEDKFGAAALLALIVGAAGAVLAVLAGIMLSREGGYVGGNFSLHQTMGIIGTAGVLLALVVRLMGMGQGNFELLHGYRALFFLSFGIMGLGAHFGGNMSHGNTFLTKYAPEAIKKPMVAMEKWFLAFVEKPKVEKTPDAPKAAVDKAPEAPKAAATPPAPAPATGAATPAAPAPAPTPSPMPAPTASGEKLVFQHVILPLLTAKCNKCHCEEKSKGDLRMDTYELAIKGGENGKNFVAGNLNDSLSITRIMLPDSDDEHMPPEGKDQLTKEEIELLKWWVQQGASNTQKYDPATIPAELKATAEAFAKS